MSEEKTEKHFEMMNALATIFMEDLAFYDAWEMDIYRENPLEGGRLVAVSEDEVSFTTERRLEVLKQHQIIFAEFRLNKHTHGLQMRVQLNTLRDMKIRTKWEVTTLESVKELYLELEAKVIKAFKRDKLELDFLGV